ncbi:uncharacterized protein PITG_09903 [Phytophthora infestans T30-4]|uniref:Tc1-like transposase DDE domain-containing protein n=1 Tax=Phytophthora infestans (strain T30-4) TaxID=403677 RepID=D0NDT7_PHYIT|nr:uncharacterized protein PITG_09903 [Phytophthora infestans T30-4]EEY56382.1 hypothetical protein PITG_09903 [Phytophthora infestans T30-4]|eukprot:XP_002902456.1 hypothetical protein PITG_09903 [Phytophthora infestans T30-4]
MLNPIENVFSSFKSSVKAFKRENRRQILDVPPGVTMKDHRQYFLQTAANQYLPEVTIAASCRNFYRHTLRFHAKVSDLKDMPVKT